MLRSLLALVLVSLLVAACGGDRPVYFGRQGSTEGMPGYVHGQKTNPNVKLGKPYRVGGQTYIPRYDPNYVEEGLASWYGPGFHGGRTANGESFDKYDFTAAHTTLPLPSIVRVTSLVNGKVVYVRVNDRGPFAEGRIIDLSKAAAEQIDLVRQGVAKVRVEYMPRESQRLVDMMNAGRNPASIDIAREIVGRRGASQQARNAPPASRWWEYVSPVHSAHAHEMPEDESVQSGDLPPPAIETRPMPQSGVADVPPSVRAMTITEPPQPQVIVPAPLPTPSYYVQLGSFSVQSNAEGMRARFAYPTIVESVIASGGNTLYRVRMGPFTQATEAEVALAEARAAGIADARVIKP